MIGKKKIVEISKKTKISEERVEKILDAVSKPLLQNIDCPHYKIGIGSSEED